MMAVVLPPVVPPLHVQCVSILVEDLADHTHTCALDVGAGPHNDCNHICTVVGCGRQWKGGA